MKILFITSTRIGDAVLSTGLLRYLHGLYPHAAITVAAGALTVPLLDNLPGVVRVWPMVKGKRAYHWRQLHKAMRATKWDLVVDLRSSAIAYVLRAKKRVIYRDPKTMVHRVRQLADLFQVSALPFQNYAPTLSPTAAQQQHAAQLLGRTMDAPQRPVLAVAPTANWICKTWHPERFVALIAQLTAENGPLPHAHVAIFGSPNERALADKVTQQLPPAQVLDLVGVPDLMTTAACLGGADMFVGNDSGLMHMAAAMGTPTLGLFGPSEDRHYAPWGWRVGWVRTDETLATIYPPGFDHRNHGVTLMDSLTVARAYDGAVRLWAQVGGGHGMLPDDHPCHPQNVWQGGLSAGYHPVNAAVPL